MVARTTAENKIDESKVSRCCKNSEEPGITMH